jgi:FkbM family methyltransferase
VRIRAFCRLTRQAAPLFLRGGDSITPTPMVSGDWQRETVALLRYLARDYGDALFDIGANIGLVSHAVRHDFKRLYCFEPNPRLFYVLSANLYEATSEGRAKLFNIGLGEADTEAVLTVPRINDAGGFVRGAGNAYTDDELRAKDYHDGQHSAPRYVEVPIVLRRGRAMLAELFSPRDARFTVKLDTEGYERTILREIAAALPGSGGAAIVFENLSPRFDARAFYRENFRRPGRVLKLEVSAEELPPLRRHIDRLLRGRTARLTESPRTWVGEVVYLVGEGSWAAP